MRIEKCLKNIRCDEARCKNFAKYSLTTSSYKGNFNFCEECFLSLKNSIIKLIKTEKKKEKDD